MSPLSDHFPLFVLLAALLAAFVALLWKDDRAEGRPLLPEGAPRPRGGCGRPRIPASRRCRVEAPRRGGRGLRRPARERSSRGSRGARSRARDLRRRRRRLPPAGHAPRRAPEGPRGRRPRRGALEAALRATAHPARSSRRPCGRRPTPPSSSTRRTSTSGSRSGSFEGRDSRRVLRLAPGLGVAELPRGDDRAHSGAPSSSSSGSRRRWWDARGLGSKVTWVGHPLVDAPPRSSRAPAPPPPLGAQRVVLMPGSRTGEIRRNLPVLRDAVRLLRRRHSDLEVVLVRADSIPTALLERGGRDRTSRRGASVRARTSRSSRLRTSSSSRPEPRPWRGSSRACRWSSSTGSTR